MSERIRPIDIPPHDAEAERSFVGGLLRHPKYLDELPTPIPVDALYSHRMRLIYATILDLREDDEPIDGVTVANRLNENGRLKDAGAETELLQLIHDTLTGAQTRYHGDIILEHWKRRRILAACEEASRDARQLDDPVDIIARLESTMHAVDAAKAESRVFDMKQVLIETVEEIKERKKSDRNTVGVPTGFVDLDNLTSGLVPSELFVIGARPSQGKTALAVSILTNVQEQVPTLLVSIEMGRESIAERMLASLSGVNSIRVRHAKVSDEEIDRMTSATAKIRSGRFWVADVPGANIAEVTQVARQVKRKQPDLAVVAIDYMQLIRHEDRRMPRHEQVADISGRLKALARSLNVCVLALAQLNRESESGKDRTPEMHHLRDSGAVEQDADIIALLHRPEFSNPEDRPGEADLIVCKVRNGPIGDVKLVFDKATTTFRNAAPSWVAPDANADGTNPF